MARTGDKRAGRWYRPAIKDEVQMGRDGFWVSVNRSPGVFAGNPVTRRLRDFTDEELAALKRQAEEKEDKVVVCWPGWKD